MSMVAMSTEEKAIEIVKNSTENIRGKTKGRMGIVKCTNFRCLGVMAEA